MGRGKRTLLTSLKDREGENCQSYGNGMGELLTGLRMGRGKGTLLTGLKDRKGETPEAVGNGRRELLTALRDRKRERNTADRPER